MSAQLPDENELIPQELNDEKRQLWSSSHTLRLFHQYRQTNDEATRDEIFSYYKNLVYILVARYKGKGVDYDDLYQEGCMGLLMAIERFDVSRGVQFSTFAFCYIKGHIIQYFRDKAWPCHVPREYKEMSLHIHQLSDELGCDPSRQEIIELLGIPEDKVDDAIAAAKVWESVNLYKIDATSECNPLLSNHVSYEDKDLELTPDRITLQNVIARVLTPEEATVIQLYYYEQWTQAEIAQELDTYQMMVSRILWRATNKLFQAIREDAECCCTSLHSPV